jgi:hypothetical protein
MLYGFTLLLRKDARFRNLQLIFIGLLISVIMPFGVVLTLAVAGAWLGWEWFETRIFDWQPVFSLGLLGGPYLLYQFWISQTDPVLAGWNAQNVNLSPWVLDFLFSFSPALILSGFGIYLLYRRKTYAPRRLLIVWLVLGLALIYLPTPLQRRFMLGFYIPTSVLAVFGIDYLRQKYPTWQKRFIPGMFFLALPTNILLILMACVSAFIHPPLLYLTRDEADAMQWINTHTPLNSLVLASPEMSQFIPALTGRRVIYGHPYETVHAIIEENRVNTFYRSFGPVDERLVLERNVNYILFGPRERLLGGDPDLSAHLLLYQAGDVRIFAGESAP